MKLKKTIALLFIVILLIGSCLVSFVKFGSWNPVATAVGLFRVCILDSAYSRTSFLGNSYVAQSEDGLNLLIEAMCGWGYTHLPEEQMGRIHVFQDDKGNQQQVSFTQNAYFAKWIWC